MSTVEQHPRAKDGPPPGGSQTQVTQADENTEAAAANEAVEPDQLWRIGGNLYDLTPFMDRHPGGRQILEMQRDFFVDATYAFEAHHMNQPKVRRMLKRYYVGPAAESSPLLSANESFYAEFRKRVNEYCRENGGTGPTKLGLAVWWFVVAGLATSHIAALATGWFWLFIPVGMFSALVGAYGHNWIHQPEYRNWAYCLDVVGISSAQWFVIHVLKHHMFTNTPEDNHWRGTAPFMVVDPAKKRTVVQRVLTPFYQPLVLFFGVLANYIDHFTQMKRDPRALKHQLDFGKLFLPTWFILYFVFQGWMGIGILLCALGVASIWYFTVALANHNTHDAWDLEKRSEARDWGEAQLLVSADVGVNLGYIASARYVWLNYHTVHHLVPAVDQSHHPAIQKILIECCEEYDVPYACYSFWRMYKEMVVTFTTARLEGQKINWRALWSQHETPHHEMEAGEAA